MDLRMDWLPLNPHWSALLDSARGHSHAPDIWKSLVSLSKYDLNFLQCARLDRAAQQMSKECAFPPDGVPRVRLALLGSSTLRHLIPGIRVAGLRWGLWCEVFEGDYGLYVQELLADQSMLHEFDPQVICLALDSPHLLDLAQGDEDNALDQLRRCWRLAKGNFSAMVIQQTSLPTSPDVLGNNEFRMQDSPQATLERLNRKLEDASDAVGVHLLAVDKYVRIEGLDVWHDPALWFRTKQEIHPRVSSLYGEYLVRLVAAQRGLCAKCMVLDLDNTLWGGEIGDVGMQGIALGQGNVAGEAFVALQRYALKLKERGIILAVCSKNDASNALLPFASHPAMVLRRSDITCFVANWEDKATNLRTIAKSLNIGTDALVFVDDSPFERNLVRRELPEVFVPELSEDPALFVHCVSRAGYFEGLALTEEDRKRSEQYGANTEREVFRHTSADMRSYLREMKMQLSWKPFDEAGLQRIVQLINKTNQFNLTTPRYSEEEVRTLSKASTVRTWQFRLTDRFGDNGVISVLIGMLNEEGQLFIDTWLMSCRVLGRQVEEAVLNLLLEGARARGVKGIVGKYIPTAKNGMVRELYARLGFTHAKTDANGDSYWRLELEEFWPRETEIFVLEEANAAI